MTQIENPLSLLKKPSDSLEIQDLLRQGGVKDPKLKKGDVRAWVDLNKLGVALVFVDEAYYTGRDDLAVGEGALILNSITFHSSDNPDFTAFAGDLPLGVKFSQSQSDLLAKLGEPEWSNPRLRKDRWLVDGTRYLVKYADELDRIQTLSIEAPAPQ